MDNLNIIPEALTIEEQYFKYLVTGGDVNSLPKPVSRRDSLLYAMCLKVGNIGGATKAFNGFYRCVLNSGSNNANFFSAIYDLGEDKKITSAKVKFRFTLRQGTHLPASISARLFANNSKARNDISGYKVDYADLYTNKSNGIAAGREYIIEVNYVANGNNVNLNTCRYLKPFIMLYKGDGVNDAAGAYNHAIDLHEISVEIDGIIYDITDTIRDFAGGTKSNIKYIESKQVPSVVAIRRMPWFNKKAIFLGDSITYGYNPDPANLGKQLSNPWVNQLQDYCGFTNVINYGISGSTIATVEAKNPMVDRFSTMVDYTDFIGVMGGTNDLSNNVKLGAFSKDESNLDKTTFYGALQTLYKGLKEKYLNSTIVAITPLNAINDNIPGGKNSLGLTMEDYRKVIREVAAYYKIPVIDLQDLVKFNLLVEEDKTTYGQDGVHPNNLGHDEIAIKLSAPLNAIGRKILTK